MDKGALAIRTLRRAVERTVLGIVKDVTPETLGKLIRVELSFVIVRIEVSKGFERETPAGLARRKADIAKVRRKSDTLTSGNRSAKDNDSASDRWPCDTI